MFNFSFKDFIEGKIFNAPGRAGQHVWKPETPVVNPGNPQELPEKLKKLKSVNIDRGFRPLPPAIFKGVQADQFGITVKRSPKPKI